ncbi:unnamed protein product, partial [Ectocarpus sp. 13 AM-2016]
EIARDVLQVGGGVVFSLACFCVFLVSRIVCSILSLLQEYFHGMHLCLCGLERQRRQWLLWPTTTETPFHHQCYTPGMVFGSLKFATTQSTVSTRWLTGANGDRQKKVVGAGQSSGNRCGSKVP